MKLYHGTKLKGKNKKRLIDFPKARKALNGVGFYLTNDIKVAEYYGDVIEYEVGPEWECALVRPINVNMVGGCAMEYVLSQQEADALVLDHALSITIH